MDWIIDFLTNQFLVIGICSWAVAQVLKTIIYAIINKKFDYRRLFGDGGMPSCHSATVAGLSVACAMECGPGSVEFALSAILAIIVCHDAMGVRLETGKQAVVINEIVEAFNALALDGLPEVKLKEFVGHTPIQVIAGVLLGIINAIVMHFIWFT